MTKKITNLLKDFVKHQVLLKIEKELIFPSQSNYKVHFDLNLTEIKKRITPNQFRLCFCFVLCYFTRNIKNKITKINKQKVHSYENHGRGNINNNHKNIIITTQIKA
jgi:hypothetical protein